MDPAYDRLVRLWLPIAQPGGLPARRTLRALLAPEASLTRFEGRDDERADLLRWCTDGAAAPVRMLVGPAGVGKTRLAVELARALPEEWATGIARPGTTAQIVPAATGCRRPVLIVVDDADAEPAADMAALLEQAAAAPDRVRVLVVARSAEAIGAPAAGTAARTTDRLGAETSARAAAGTAARPAAPECTTLRAGGSDHDRRRVFAEAVRAFSGLPAPASAEPSRGQVDTDGTDGTDGTDNPVGPHGPHGPHGPDGPDGAVGADGAVGPVGAVGAVSPDDVVGPASPVGPDDADGPIDAVGAVSPDGTDGTDGPIGADDPDNADGGEGPVGADGEPIGVTLARAALAADAWGPVLRAADLGELTEELLRAEQRRWAATAADPRWSLDGLAPDAQEEALLALLLHRPHRIDDAVAALRTLDRFWLASDEHVHDVATWAGHLYPGPVGGHWLDPQPELVRWALYDAAFDRHRSLLLAALDRDPAGYLRIARAAAGHPRLAASLDALLAVVPLDAVVEAAIGAGPPGLVLRDHLVAALAVCSPAAVDVERLHPSTAGAPWAPVRIALRRAAVRHLRAAADPTADPTADTPADSTADTPADSTGEPAAAPTDGPAAEFAGHLETDPGDARRAGRVGDPVDVVGGRAALAAALTALGGALGDLRAHTDALGPRREAVQIYRDLAAEPELAMALTDLSESLRALGEHDDALGATREAVRRFRELAIADPDRHGGDLARALTDLGTDLRNTRAHEDALTVSREAVQRCRDLAAASSARHLPDLAVALTGLGADLRESGAHGDALAVSREAVRLYRDVVANNAERRSPDLARALTDLGVDLNSAGESDEAVVACREAVRRFEEQAAPDDHRPGLARALTALSAALRATGGYHAGIVAGRDAVRRYRELAAANPDRHTPDLARALTQLGISLRGLRSSDEGLAVGWEAVQLTRELAAADPDRHNPDLARALTELGSSLRGLAAHPESLVVTSEAVELGRVLAVGDPARHVADLTRALISLGASLRALGRRPEALAHEGEAVAWWWYLTQTRPGEFDDDYREAQRRHFHTFSPYEQDPDGLLTTESIARSRVLTYLESRRRTALAAPAGGDDEGFQAAATA